ncbi:GntR family transcriptional regulator [Labilibacter marinus]|uniref:GntR family transcriptional regulator n=1 Tax=Labilibacter marinus TaxID=1477105 RepID=UPI00082D0CAF|nr:GntR family transcriptional regulator [Labilibacter marinus]
MLKFEGHVPIYKKLIDFYSKKIVTQELKPGSRIDSINKMMSRHQVSRETAKRVIKALIEEKLVVSQVGRGTFVNSTTELIKVWGVVIPFYSNNIEQLISEINLKAQAAGRKMDYFLHYNNPEEEMRIIGELIRKGYEAVVVVPNYDETVTGEFYIRLNSGNTKIVLADYTMTGSYFKYAIQSYDLGVKRAVDYLFEQHDGNYLLLSHERWQGKNMVFSMMEDTFEMLLQLKSGNNKLFHCSNINELTEDYFRANNIKGVLSVQDSITIRLIGRMKNWGISIPEEVAVVSYGNTELTKLFAPSITVIDSKYDVMADRIQKLICNEKVNNEQIVIQPELIVRNT